MSLLSLNCRGLGNPSRVHNLRDLIRREAPSLIFLSERKLHSGENSQGFVVDWGTFTVFLWIRWVVAEGWLCYGGKI